MYHQLITPDHGTTLMQGQHIKDLIYQPVKSHLLSIGNFAAQTSPVLTQGTTSGEIRGWFRRVSISDILQI